ncbi:hypothetical protein MAUB1S_10933 [Mycolicibacterium aubagnense]
MGGLYDQGTAGLDGQEQEVAIWSSRMGDQRTARKAERGAAKPDSPRWRRPSPFCRIAPPDNEEGKAVRTGSPSERFRFFGNTETLQLFVFTQFQTQNRCTVLLELLSRVTVMTIAIDSAPKRRKGMSFASFEPWLYLSPAIVLLVTVLLVPLIIGIGYSFRKFSAFKSEFVGFGQYQAMLSDPLLGEALVNTAWWTIASLFFQFFLGLGLALLLDKPFAGRRVVQALVFLPWAVPSFLSGLTWAWLFNPIIGPLPHWLYALGLKAEPTNILSDPATAMWGPIIANVWFGVPFFAITLLAALKSIPSELHEAAAIDGATPWQRFVKVTLPFLAPTIAITVMLRTIWIATFADLIFVMTEGGPAGSTATMPVYIYVSAFKSLDKGYASAIAVLLLVLLILYAIVLIGIRRTLVRHV